MASSPRHSLALSTVQRLQQRMSPLQVRYARLLEMNAQEAEEEVRRTLDENPALIVAEEAEARADHDSEPALSAPSPAVPYYRYGAALSSSDGDGDRWEPQLSEPEESLYDSLTHQLAVLDITPRQRAIAEYIVGNLDENGYLTREINEMADDLLLLHGWDVEYAEIKSALDVVRSLDPAGVGAVDLRDCLLQQIKRLDGDSAELATARTIVSDYFDLFSKMHFDALCQALGISRKQLEAAVEVIRSLNPKPGGAIGAEKSQHVIPDFFVDSDSEGQLTLTLVNNIPELQIEATFSSDTLGKSLHARKDADESLRFIRSRREDAEDFIRVVRQRQQTLFRVMSAIVKLQHDFFASGDPSDIKPLVLKDIAALTGDDLSVISRATAGKYVATPHGLYPLKYFFTERSKARQEDVSQHKIMEALKEIIAAEDKKHPLSDAELKARLADAGYDLARRTVTKYRERLGLPVARMRKSL